jgi:hypothetical protein
VVPVCEFANAPCETSPCVAVSHGRQPRPSLAQTRNVNAVTPVSKFTAEPPPLTACCQPASSCAKSRVTGKASPQMTSYGHFVANLVAQNHQGDCSIETVSPDITKIIFFIQQ